jgi:hypothetical protein
MTVLISVRNSFVNNSTWQNVNSLLLLLLRVCFKVQDLLYKSWVLSFSD